MLKAGVKPHCLRDLTRGGLASALVEIAESGQVHVNVDEREITVREDVQGACEILGLDPIYVANEGRFVAFVAPTEAHRALDVLKSNPTSANARLIGNVVDNSRGLVTMTTKIGASRIVDMLSGEQLPRIC